MAYAKREHGVTPIREDISNYFNDDASFDGEVVIVEVECQINLKGELSDLKAIYR